MTLLEKIQNMDAISLKNLEENARRILMGGPASKHSEATQLVDAIAAERIRRIGIERQQRESVKVSIRDKIKDLNLFDRVILAFEEMPPEEWEVTALNAVASNPGADFQTLARAIGKQEGGYINLAIGTICSLREPYLSLPGSPERRVFSELVIDFTLHKNNDGSEWHGWTLKPEAEAALRHLGIISVAAAGS